MVTKSKNFYKKGNLPKLFFFIAVCISFINKTSAQGDLLIFPKRVVFDGGKRVKQLILSNTGKDSAVYNVSFVQYRMSEFGEFQAITEPDVSQRFATPYLRVYPRRVTLAPNESQIVKVQLTKSTQLEDGEYRSHLYFRAEKNNNPLGQENKTIDSTTISIKLEAVFGISIATIIKKGTSNTITKISDLVYEEDENSNHILGFSIHRSGNMSTYGDIYINYISKDNISQEVAKVKGLAVYTPGKLRKVKIQLKKLENIDYNSGKFKIVYTKNESKDILAEEELNL